jgi:hypothetical protein
MEMRAKLGVGYCMNTIGAVEPFRRLKAGPKPASTPEDPTTVKRSRPTAPLSPKTHHQLFQALLDEEELKLDRGKAPDRP